MTHPILTLLAQAEGASAETIAGVIAGFIAAFSLVFLAIAVVLIIAMWKVFEKAGQPGWAILVPFYNLVILFRIGGQSGWWAASFLLNFIPVIGTLAYLVIFFINQYKVSVRFGQGVPFAIGLILLSPIFWCLLAFGDYKYQPAAKTA